MSNCVEIATGWYKPQKHLSPVYFHISDAIGYALQHFDFGVTSFGKGIGGMIIKVIQDRLPPPFQSIAPPY